jgi:glutamate-1-semialdehyde aminotransferase
MKNLNKEYLDKAKKYIPGISQLFGKRPELSLPGNDWPNYYSKAKGVIVWDLNNKKYIDFTMVGVGTSVLGYADRSISKKAIEIIKKGSISTLNCHEDVDLAKILIDLHPWAGGVKFCRTGGESMSVAVRIARAFTGKDKILFCGYHGWHDWYMASNIKSSKTLNYHLLPGIKPKGIPKNLKNTIIPFKFNDYNDLKKIVSKNAKKAAAIILEPARERLVERKFLNELKKISKKNNCLLILDEITSGWRIIEAGVHRKLKINPDIVVYGKTIANGIPMGAIVGKKKIMNISLKTFISSVFWTERLGPACALEFIKNYRKNKVNIKLIKIGKKVKKIWLESAKKNDLKIEISGLDPLASFSMPYKNWPAILTFFIQEMLLKHRIIASSRCYANLKHTEKLLKYYAKSVDDVFKSIKYHLKNKDIEKFIKGPVKQMGFNRLTK